jgi:hypothetical protein
MGALKTGQAPLPTFKIAFTSRSPRTYAEDLANSSKALRASEALSVELSTVKARGTDGVVDARSKPSVAEPARYCLGNCKTNLEASPLDFRRRFETRIQALSSSHNLLVQNGWQGADLKEVATSQLAHFGDLTGKRLLFQGAKPFVTSTAARAPGMAFHELAINAAKYGALSGEGGYIGISWYVMVEGLDHFFRSNGSSEGGQLKGPCCGRKVPPLGRYDLSPGFDELLALDDVQIGERGEPERRKIE